MIAVSFFGMQFGIFKNAKPYAQQESRFERELSEDPSSYDGMSRYGEEQEQERSQYFS